jgi:hypothetical protein
LPEPDTIFVKSDSLICNRRRGLDFARIKQIIFNGSREHNCLSQSLNSLDSSKRLLGILCGSTFSRVGEARTKEGWPSQQE